MVRGFKCVRCRMDYTGICMTLRVGVGGGTGSSQRQKCQFQVRSPRFACRLPASGNEAAQSRPVRTARNQCTLQSSDANVALGQYRANG